jgi:hypothetical protein
MRQVEIRIVREKLPQGIGIHSRLPVRGPATVKDWAPLMIPAGSPNVRKTRSEAPGDTETAWEELLDEKEYTKDRITVEGRAPAG